MNLPPALIRILDTLSQHGHQSYVVGGAVRDFLMQRSVADFDIATSATPEQMAQLFEKTIDTGSKFGTMTVLMASESYELTTFRIDGTYLNHRKPNTVQFTTNIIKDLSRRDFTINAIAYTPLDGLLDPFGGQRHIADKVIQAVGDPHQRFTEDALRMLRALRFATKLGFTIEANTYEALCELAPLMANISLERVREELVKLFLSTHLAQALYLNHTHLLNYVHTGFYAHLQAHLATALPAMAQAPTRTVIRWAILLQELPPLAVKDMLRFFKFSNDDIKQITLLITHHHMAFTADPYCIKKHVLKLGHNGFADLLALKTACHVNCEAITQVYEHILATGEPIFMNQLVVNGDLLAEHGVAKGKTMGALLHQLHEAVLHEPGLNTTPQLLARI